MRRGKKYMKKFEHEKKALKDCSPEFLEALNGFFEIVIENGKAEPEARSSFEGPDGETNFVFLACRSLLMFREAYNLVYNDDRNDYTLEKLIYFMLDCIKRHFPEKKDFLRVSAGDAWHLCLLGAISYRQLVDWIECSTTFWAMFEAIIIMVVKSASYEEALEEVWERFEKNEKEEFATLDAEARCALRLADIRKRAASGTIKVKEEYKWLLEEGGNTRPLPKTTDIQ